MLIFANLNLRRSLLAGSAAASSAASGALTVINPLVGSASASSAATGIITVRKPVAGSAVGAASASGALFVAKPLAGHAVGAASASGALATVDALGGAIVVSSAATGVLSGAPMLAGAFITVTHASGTLEGTYPTRVSQVVIEALERSPYANFVRCSQSVPVATVAATEAHVRASQAVPVVVNFSTTPHVRASQGVVVNPVFSTEPPVRASQAVTAALVASNLYTRVSQAVLVALVVNKDLQMPSLFPNLIGLTWSVTKRPIFNTLMGQAASGRQVRLAMYEYPLWEWDLTWDSLPDGNPAAASTYASDFKQLVGFFLEVQGSCFSFNYLDQDDNHVIGQPVGVGDGSTAAWTLFRTYGGSDGTGTEPVGYINTSGPVLSGNTSFNVYFGGVLQAPDTYAVVQTVPLNQQIRFNTSPPEGTVITADFSFYYYVHFKDDQYDFDKIWSQMWSQKKITLASVRQ